MRCTSLIVLLLSCILVAFLVNVEANQVDLLKDAEVLAFIEEQANADAEFQHELELHVGDSLEDTPAASSSSSSSSSAPAPAKNGGAGGVYKGGKRRKLKPNLRKGAKDGSTLPPFDPFRIHRRFQRKLKKRHERRQRKVELENQLEVCRAKKERAERRAAAEAAEIAAEKAEQEAAAAAKAAAAAQRASRTETDLMEVASEVDIDAMELAAEEAEFKADAAEAETDFAEMEHDILMELEAENGRSSPITYGFDNMENFDNSNGHAVFKRRAKARQAVHFEKTSLSSGGNAVVTGVTKLPCGKEITDKGLFAAKVSNNLGATVTAVDPNEPKLVDQNINTIHHLPVVPQFKSEGGVDEYGDPID